MAILLFDATELESF